MTITGLPFTAAADAGVSFTAYRLFATDMPNLRAIIASGTTSIILVKNATNTTTATALSNTDMDKSGTGNQSYFSATYRV